MIFQNNFLGHFYATVDYLFKVIYLHEFIFLEVFSPAKNWDHVAIFSLLVQFDSLYLITRPFGRKFIRETYANLCLKVEGVLIECTPNDFAPDVQQRITLKPLSWKEASHITLEFQATDWTITKTWKSQITKVQNIRIFADDLETTVNFVCIPHCLVNLKNMVNF